MATNRSQRLRKKLCYGLVCLQKRGSVSEEQRAAVEAWLKARPELTSVEVSPLLDVWYPEKPINPVA